MSTRESFSSSISTVPLCVPKSTVGVDGYAKGEKIFQKGQRISVRIGKFCAIFSSCEHNSEF